jgi:hypothetical protein
MESIKKRIKESRLGGWLILEPYRKIVKPARTILITLPISSAILGYVLIVALEEGLSKRGGKRR